jgi:hypothetical protein
MVLSSLFVESFSVGIPHKEAAVGCCDEVHPLAKVCKLGNVHYFLSFFSTNLIVNCFLFLFFGKRSTA